MRARLLPQIRFLVYLFSALLWLLIFFLITGGNQFDQQTLVKLVETYALTAVTYLYLALIASPLYQLLPNLPFKSLHLVARKAIGVSCYFFALTHASFAFFGLLGGFGGLATLPTRYFIAITFSFTALIILSIMALTSLQYFVKKLGRHWKTIHRFVYLAGVLIIIHALLLGSHFSDLSGFIPEVSLTALGFLLILEAIRFDKWLSSKFSQLPRLGLAFSLTLAAVVVGLVYINLPSGSVTSFINIHAAHQQLAAQALQSSQNQTNANPALSGDKTKRYTVSFNQPTTLPNQNTTLDFKIFDAASGNPASFFTNYYQYSLHLIIVDPSLTYFSHLHPTQNGNEFKIQTQFPSTGLYHLYLDFQPQGAIEQQIAFTLQVGSPNPTVTPRQADKTLTKTFGDIQVSLNTHGSLQANQLSLGNQKLSFTLADTKTKKPITNIQPYLNTFGHLVMINQQTYEYAHVHPYNLTAPKPNATFGPTVDFLPIGIYAPFKSGNYRLFAQFNVGGKLFVADFTVKVN